ncbi:ribonuclease H-like domain-containing protein [Tanacetum coccineum]
MYGEEPAPQMTPVKSPQMISIVKLHMLKKDENGVETEVPPKTAQAILARQKERKAKSILLLAIPDEYQLRFHTIKDAKSLWAAIKSRFGGNVESKKMQKNVLKQQFENFSVSDTEGLDKAYDRFQKLISLLEVHGAAVPNEDANQIFLRALPLSWNNVALIMRNKDDHNSQGQASSSYTNDLMFSFFANQSNSPQLDDEDLEQIDHDDLKEIDLKCQVAMLSMRVKRFYKKTGRKLIFNCKEPVGFDKTKDNALIVQDGLGYDWSYIAQAEPTEFALMSYTSNLSVSDTEAYMFDSRSSDGDDNQTNDMFKKDNEYHAVPPPLTVNYMPPLADLSFAGLMILFIRPTSNKNYASGLKLKNIPPSNIANGLRMLDKIWNNTQRINHQNKFVPTAVLTRSGRIPVSTAKQVSKVKVNTVKVNNVNTAGQTAVSTVKGNGVTAVKASAGCVWRPKMTDLNNGSKDNSGSWISKRGNPQQALKYKGMFDSGCSRHITRNKALLTEYKDIDGGFVSFGGSTRGGKITGKPCKRSSFKDLKMTILVLLVRRESNTKPPVFFLATKSETSGILKKFITEVENQLNHKVKVIKSDNRIEFKNREMDEFCGQKGIKREYNVAITPQQNGVAE